MPDVRSRFQHHCVGIQFWNDSHGFTTMAAEWLELEPLDYHTTRYVYCISDGSHNVILTYQFFYCTMLVALVAE